MLAKIFDILGKDYQLLIKNEFDQARVTIKYLKTNETHSCLVPLEYLEDNRIVEVVEISISKLKEKNI